jgi:hypothetical protein
MNNLTVRDVLIAFGFLIPPYSEITKDEFIDLIKDIYDVSNPKTSACVKLLENSDIVSLKRETNKITIKK